MWFPAGFGDLFQTSINLRKISARPRAVVRKRTSRIDEREQQRTAAVPRKVDLLSILVYELEIGNLVSYSRHRDGGFGRPPAAL